MKSHRALAVQVEQALRIRLESERAGALHRLVEAAIDCGPDILDTNEQDRLASKYGDAYRVLRERTAQTAMSEIDLSIWARAGDRERMVCCISVYFDWPIELAELCNDGPDAGLLLLACRSENFAWSTVNALLMLNSDRAGDHLFMLQCSEDYHALATADAKRFMRLVRINLQNRVQPSQVGTLLRVKVK